jgi:hypothetical protein
MTRSSSSLSLAKSVLTCIAHYSRGSSEVGKRRGTWHDVQPYKPAVVNQYI